MVREELDERNQGQAKKKEALLQLQRTLGPRSQMHGQVKGPLYRSNVRQRRGGRIGNNIGGGA